MRSVRLLFCLWGVIWLAPTSMLAQQKVCGTVVTPEQVALEAELAAEGAVPAIAPPVSQPYRLPLSLHIVRHSDGTGGFPPRELADALQNLNRLWRPVGIQFFQYGNVDFINDTSLLSPSDLRHRDELRRRNPVANAINVYFTNLGLTDRGDLLCGETYFSSSPVQGMLIDNDCARDPFDPLTSTWAHEMGHYFNLYHTHEAMAMECPMSPCLECPRRGEGSNCRTAGDLLCDTEADPGLTWETVTSDCIYYGRQEPPRTCDSTPYDPPTHNLMSYSRPWCRNAFTGEQINKALTTLTFRRQNLVTSHTKYVDAAAAPGGTGSPQRPFRTVAEAVNAAQVGDFIIVKAGSYPNPLRINKRVTVMQWDTGSIVRIGR